MKTEKAPGKNGLPPEAYKILVGLGEDVLEYHHAILDRPRFQLEIWKHVVLIFFKVR
jgi:hypothetical protein